MKYKTLTLIGLLILLATHDFSPSNAAPDEVSIQDIQFAGADFAEGAGSGFAITSGGLTLADDAVTAVYTSPIIQSPVPFNALVPQWIADVPDTAGMKLSARTKTTTGAWGQWEHIHENHDWTLPGDPDLVGQMLVVPAADQTHRQIQYSVSFSRYAGETAPVLHQLTFTVIDATAGPTVEEMQAQQAILNAAASNAPTANGETPRPAVISRDIWCYYDACDYTDGLNYSPATHMVIHHTVSANSSGDWAAIVRAIWNFHTYTRDWGDIGYNYLIDRTGVIYEGHMNEDYLNLDVVGTHAAAANTGGMGVSLIGTFSTPDEYPGYDDTPPPEMLAAAVDLLSWKADQRDIDVYGASRMPYTDWGLPHLMGHRDVYGGTNTSCPGGNAYDLLPYLRDETAQRINFTSPHIYIDELSDAFAKSDNNWYEGPKGCGNNGHSYYTWNVNDASLVENWGEWRPNVPENGRYEIEVYAPYCDINASETAGAIYTVSHINGTDTVAVSHEANVGLWMSLGEFDLAAGTGNLVRLTDLTTGDPTNYDYGVWFDAIRLRQIEAFAAPSAPPDDAWANQATVDFAWNIVNPGQVLMTTLQVAADAGFSDIVYEESWGTAVTAASHAFSQDYVNLYWRVRLDTNFGNQTDSDAVRFGLDTAPPTSAVTALNVYTDGHYELFWQGSDSLSGVAGYDIEYRADGETIWTPLLAGTTAITGTFTPPVSGETYWFRSQAADVAGNEEAPPSGDGDISTDQAIPIYAPAVDNQSPAPSGLIGDETVIFDWILADITDPLTSTLRVATDAGFSNVILTKPVIGATTIVSHTFSQDYATLYWQVTVEFTPPQGGSSDSTTSASTSFALDISPPTSQAATIYELATGNYLLFWGGNDAVSSVASYTIEYRAQGDAVWTELVSDTAAVSASFTPSDPAQTYEFRSQATDLAGNVEPPHANPDLDTTQAILLSHAIMMPIITR
ncbi:MAG: hypothetical protein GY803_24695 [Chloroflexi bacterium]|nr:hypothetical protein [Chloroflexota bacterium]